MQDQLNQLIEFHETFKVFYAQSPTVDVPDDAFQVRLKLLSEELAEYRQAAEAGDLVETADALIDLLYVLLGTFITHGLQDVAAALFDEVHRSNMSKLDAAGRPIYRADGKVLKSALFSPPDLGRILNAGSELEKD